MIIPFPCGTKEIVGWKALSTNNKVCSMKFKTIKTMHHSTNNQHLKSSVEFLKRLASFLVE